MQTSSFPWHLNLFSPANHPGSPAHPSTILNYSWALKPQQVNLKKLPGNSQVILFTQSQPWEVTEWSLLDGLGNQGLQEVDMILPFICGWKSSWRDFSKQMRPQKSQKVTHASLRQGKSPDLDQQVLPGLHVAFRKRQHCGLLLDMFQCIHICLLSGHAQVTSENWVMSS